MFSKKSKLVFLIIVFIITEHWVLFNQAKFKKIEWMVQNLRFEILSSNYDEILLLKNDKGKWLWMPKGL